MNTSANQVDPNDALSSALADGDISQASHQIMVENLDTQVTLGAQGVSPDDLAEDRVTLVVPIVDVSYSRKDEAGLMRSEFNAMLDALDKSKARETILVSSWLFDTRVQLLHGFLSLDDAIRLDATNYNPDGSTAMYDAVLDVFTSTAAYAKTLTDQGYRVKIVIVVITDGEENASQATAMQVNQVAKDLLAQEIYVLALVAFGSGYAQAEAINMGIPDENVIEYGLDPKDVRRAFSLVSSSVIRQSQTQIGSSSSFFSTSP